MMKRVGVYIHIPFCKSKCAYCNFTSMHCNEVVQKRYVEALTREIADTLNNNYEVETLYIGGGTPSILDAGSIEKIVNSVRNNSTYKPSEVTIECNPDSIEESKLLAYKRLGINRISIGVQSLNDDILHLIGRIHTASEAITKVKLAVSFGFNTSVDMILGLPNSTFEDIKYFVDTFSDIGVNHISAYSLSVEEGTRLHEMVERGEVIIPSDDEDIDEYEFAYNLMKNRDYNRYEVSNFAKSGSESRHNNKYWLMEDYIGFGVASHSLLDGVRYYNTNDIEEYIENMHSHNIQHILEEKLSRDDLLEETIMLGLRLERGVEIAKIDDIIHDDFLMIYRNKLEKVSPYINIHDGYLAIKPEYMNVMNSIIIEILG